MMKLFIPLRASICTLNLQSGINWLKIVDFRAKKSQRGLNPPAPFTIRNTFTFSFNKLIINYPNDIPSSHNLYKSTSMFIHKYPNGGYRLVTVNLTGTSPQLSAALLTIEVLSLNLMNI